MRWSVCPIVAALVGLLWPSAAHASNPPVTLALEEVTCKQALEALTKATGLPFELREPTLQPGAKLPESYARLLQRRNFTWRNVRLAFALRQIAREYGLRLSRYSNTFSFAPELGAAQAAPAPKISISKQGVTIFPSYVSMSSQRSQNLETGQAADQSANLNLRLKLQWPEGEPDTVVGFDNVVARDDQGNVLLWNAPFNLTRRPTTGGGFPDEWYENLSLTDPHPRAKKLQWLEADLLVYGVYRPITLEIPLTDKQKLGVKRSGDVEAAIIGYEPPAMTPGTPPTSGPTVKSKVVMPQGERSIAPAFGYSPTPVLVGASGKLYPSRGGRSSGNTRQGVIEYELESRYPVINEPVVKAVFTFVERGEPRKLFSFRLDDIPLPTEGTFVPRQQPPPSRSPKAPPKVERPYRQPGGGTLVFRAEIGGAPVSNGTVAVGLAPKQGAEWGPLRWQDVQVDKSGLARLPDLAPGVYRVLRIYRTAATRRLDADGQWQNSEVQATLVAGQTTTAAPLQWSSKPTAPK
ncbi:MAG: hypothetical protein ACO1SX_15050 [Actinomycetota bacterium]